jgi:hypothetical protein
VKGEKKFLPPNIGKVPFSIKACEHQENRLAPALSTVVWIVLTRELSNNLNPLDASYSNLLLQPIISTPLQ